MNSDKVKMWIYRKLKKLTTWLRRTTDKIDDLRVKYFYVQ